MKNLVEINKIECKKFEERLTNLYKKYSEKENNITGKNEILRKWYNLCNLNYYTERGIIKDYLNGESINGAKLDEMQYRIQIGYRIHPLFVNSINSFEYICEVLYLNSPKLQQELKQNKERSRMSEYREKFAKLEYITTEQEKQMLNFWSMRNAMHRNNYPREKIEFEIVDYTDGERLEYKVDIGESLYSPEWGLDKITEAMSSIMIDIVNNIPDLEIKNIKDIV